MTSLLRSRQYVARYAWLGVLTGIAALGWHVYNHGIAVGQVRGKAAAEGGMWDDGWNDGYDRGFNACRDKAIEFGVQALCD